MVLGGSIMQRWPRIVWSLVTTLTLAGCGPAAQPSGQIRISQTIAARIAGYAPAYQPALVQFTDSGHGFIAGSRCSPDSAHCAASIARTSDGGRTWQFYSAGDIRPDFLQFVSSRNGFLGGFVPADCYTESCSYELLRTQNGGTSWQTVYRGRQLRSEHFLSPEVGFALVPASTCPNALSCGTVERSEDGGRSWAPLPLPQGFNPVSLDFLSPQLGWVSAWRCPAPGSTCQGALLRTGDGGRDWTLKYTPAPTATRNGGPFDVSFATRLVGWLRTPIPNGCSMGGCWTALYRTEDGGASWREIQPAMDWRVVSPHPEAPPGWQLSLDFLSPLAGFIPVNSGAGPGTGGILRTRDGGVSWTLSRPLWSIDSFSAVTAEDAWAVGHINSRPGSFLAHSTDGVHWQEVHLTCPHPAVVQFTRYADGHGLGTTADPGSVLASSDGGTSWAVVGDVAGYWPNVLSFPTARRGWLVAVAWGLQQVFETSDGGHLWTHVGEVRGSLKAPLGLWFFRDGSGMYATSGGLYRTSDGGRTWRRVARVRLPSLSQAAFSFTSPRDGWAVESVFRGQKLGHRPRSRTTIRRTQDGALTWQTVGTLQGLYATVVAADFTSRQRGWILLLDWTKGKDEVPFLLRTMDGGHTFTRVVLPRSAARALGTPGLSASGADDLWLTAQSGGRTLRSTDGGRTFNWLP